jgi:phosphoglycolate phosphatase-like HAD superfamily hydrolase
MRKKHVIFDFDGVLCDSLASCVEEYERLRIERFPALPAVAVQDRMDVAFNGPLKTALLPWLSEQESRDFFDLHSAAMLKRSESLRPFAGVEELLTALPLQSVSIVSSAYNQAIKHVIAAPSGQLPLAVRYILGRDSRMSKSQKIRVVLDRERLISSEALYVGDLHSDLIYCQSVPIDCILVSYGYHSPDHLERVASTSAYAIVHRVHELADVLMDRLAERIAT